MSRRSLPALIACTILPMLVGCSAPAADAAVSDTVAIDPTASDAPLVTIDEATPAVWSYGGLQTNPDDEIDNQGMLGVVRLSGDRYFMAEGNRVRLFDAQANGLWRTGRAGAGPADFHGLGWPCRFHGDTVVVYDQGNRRIAYIDPGVGVIATVPAVMTEFREGACTGDGAFVTFRMIQDTVAKSGEYVVEVRTGSGSVPTTVFREPSPLGLVVGHGDPWAGAVDTLVWVSNADKGTITLLDRQGNFVRQLDWRAEREPVTDDNIPGRYGLMPGGLSSKKQVDAWWDRVRAMKRVANWPAFAYVTADADGRLWIIERYDEPRRFRQYWVVSRTGRIVARVQFPAESGHYVSLTGFVPGGVVLRHVDDDGAPHYRVVPYPEALRP